MRTSWPGVEVIGDQEVMIDAPSQLPEHLVAASAGRRLVLHAMHSVVDWLAFAVWEDGRLVRSLSLSPDSGIIENIGEPLPFELNYWAGDRPPYVIAWPDKDEEPYPLPFHPPSRTEPRSARRASSPSSKGGAGRRCHRRSRYGLRVGADSGRMLSNCGGVVVGFV
ncbi:DUF6928 family protein [Streptomyces sp. NRRL WC-3626]|uniref:DUF6928 family protein n=1 Tax=Streptomyces sp. NRRL WC-3626 TaxID=1463926 RepID=UPI001F35FE6A|nr:hypothetical protein [Streptomyces sp. NRRL WC-3626]